MAYVVSGKPRQSRRKSGFDVPGSVDILAHASATRVSSGVFGVEVRPTPSAETDPSEGSAATSMALALLLTLIAVPLGPTASSVAAGWSSGHPVSI